MKRAHENGHEGAISTLHRSRKEVWIISGHALAETVSSGCTECWLKERRCMEQ
jgi:hypothetical protein